MKATIYTTSYREEGLFGCHASTRMGPISLVGGGVWCPNRLGFKLDIPVDDSLYINAEKCVQAK